jgi:hypothetical protein
VIFYELGKKRKNKSNFDLVLDQLMVAKSYDAYLKDCNLRIIIKKEWHLNQEFRIGMIYANVGELFVLKLESVLNPPVVKIFI